jgi:hypothetical protein
MPRRATHRHGLDTNRNRICCYSVGLIRWQDGRRADQKLVRIASGAPLYRREELGYHDKSEWEPDAKGEPRDPWQPAIYLPIMDTTGELGTFTTSSGSGIKSVQRLLRLYRNHATRHPNDYPLIKLGVDHYTHSDRSIGKIFYPVFKPAGYVDRREFVEALEAVGATIDTPVSAALPSAKDEFNDDIPY